MKITKRRKIILSSVLVAMVAITAGFEISSSQVMEPISQTGDIKEMGDISLVSQKNITGRTRFAIFEFFTTKSPSAPTDILLLHTCNANEEYSEGLFPSFLPSIAIKSFPIPCSFQNFIFLHSLLKYSLC